MKKAMLLALATLFIASSVFALPGTGYIGVYGDIDHSICSISPAAFAPFDVWIMCLPSERGLQAAEWATSFPATVVTTVTVQNPDITVALGSLQAGISVAFGNCQLDWVYTHHLTCLALATAPGFIGIIPHPTTLPPAFQFASCELGFPIEPILRSGQLNLYQDCTIATKDATWGAIKNLF